MGGCADERPLEEVLNDSGIECVSKFLWLLLFLVLKS